MAINVGDALFKIKGDPSDLNQAMDQAEKKVKSSTEKMQQGLKIAGAAFTAMGVAGLAMVGSARKMNAQLGQTAITLGVSTGEMRDLALATTNVTFPLESVTKTFDLLARAGMRSTEEMKASATAFDTLGDATGASAEVVAAQLIPAFKLFGVEMPKSAEELDNFTWLTKNTTVELSEFGSVMSYVAQYGDQLSISLDDMIAIMAVLESKGKSGSTATKMFRTAVTQAASGVATLNDALGITQEEIDVFKEEMDDATGITQEYADVANEQYSIMDKLKQKFSEITLRMGSFLTPLEPMLAGMTALGPLMIFMGSSMGAAAVKTAAHTVALIAHNVVLVATKIAVAAATAAQWLLNAAMTANPIGIIIVAIGALIAAIVLMVKHWDTISEFFVNLWAKIKNVFGKIWDFLKEWGLFVASIIFPPLIIVAAIIKWKDKIVEALKTAWEKIKSFLKDWGLFILSIIFPPLLIAAVILKWKDKIIETAGNVKDAIVNAFRAIWDGIASAFTTAYEVVEKGISWIIDKVTWLLEALGILKSSGETLPPAFTGKTTVIIPHTPISPEDLEALLSLQHGGIVPGPIGKPIPILAHGGEAVIPPDRDIGGDTVINIYYPVVRQEEDIYNLTRIIARELEIERQSRGRRTGG